MKLAIEGFHLGKDHWNANVYSHFSVSTMMSESNVIRSMFISATNFNMSNDSSIVSHCLPPPPDPICSAPVKPERFDPVDSYDEEEFSFPTLFFFLKLQFLLRY